MIFLHNVAGLAFRVLFELVQSKIRQLYDPPRIDQTVRGAQRAVILYYGLVEIDHALKKVKRGYIRELLVRLSSNATVRRDRSIRCEAKRRQNSRGEKFVAIAKLVRRVFSEARTSRGQDSSLSFESGNVYTDRCRGIRP